MTSIYEPTASPNNPYRATLRGISDDEMRELSSLYQREQQSLTYARLLTERTRLSTDLAVLERVGEQLRAKLDGVNRRIAELDGLDAE